MTFLKRLFDLICGLGLLIVLTPVIGLITLAIYVQDGRPIFYISERMKTIDQPFKLIKFRTMTTSREDSGVSGGNKDTRITATGALIRQKRLDEIPQLWNILKGDMSFVGPRPPLREYTQRFPEIYQKVLESRPGVTGLASAHFHKHEEYLLSKCKSRQETDEVYSRRCIPRKAKLDLIYQSNRSICFDIGIMLKTVFKSLR